MYKTLHFDQYSRLAIRSNIIIINNNNLKMNLKFKLSFPLVCRSC